VDKSGIVHAAIGKKSFAVEGLEENLRVFVEAIVRAKPAAAKGHYIRSITVSSTMGPASPWIRRCSHDPDQGAEAGMVTALAARLRRSSTVYVTDFTDWTSRRSRSCGAGSGRPGRHRFRGGERTRSRAGRWLTRRCRASKRTSRGRRAWCSRGGPVAAAKVLADFAKEFEKPAIKVGLVDGKTVTPDLVKRLASLPTKHELLAQLGGALQAPMAGFLGALNGVLMNMVGALEALRTKRATDGGALLTSRRPGQWRHRR